MTFRPTLLPVLALATSALACSDPPPRPARLGLMMTLRTQSIPATEGRSCGAGTGITWDLGSPSPTSMSPGGTWEHETNDSDITCTVRDGGAFQARGGGVDPQIAAGSMPGNALINFTLSGTASQTAGAANEAQASVYTTPTFEVRAPTTGFPPCRMTVVHEIKPGALWADFECPALTDPSRTGVACRGFGTIVLEYCKTGEED